MGGGPVTSFDLALVAHWAMTRLGVAILIASGAPIVGGVLALASGDAGWLWLGLVLAWPLAGFYLLNLKIPETTDDYVSDEDDDS
jgi:hypothetical protein